MLSSERFFAEPGRWFRQVLDFLELPAFTPTPTTGTTPTTTGGWATRSAGAWSSTTASPTEAVRVARRRPRLERLVQSVAADDAARQDLTTLARGGASTWSAPSPPACSISCSWWWSPGAWGPGHRRLLRGRGPVPDPVQRRHPRLRRRAAADGAALPGPRPHPRPAPRPGRRPLAGGRRRLPARAGRLVVRPRAGRRVLPPRRGRDRPAGRLHPHLRRVRARLGADAGGVRGHPRLRHHAANGVPGQDRPPGPAAPAGPAGRPGRVGGHGGAAYLGPYLPVLAAGLVWLAVLLGRAERRAAATPRRPSPPGRWAGWWGSSGASPARAGWRRSSRPPRCG